MTRSIAFLFHLFYSYGAEGELGVDRGGGVYRRGSLGEGEKQQGKVNVVGGWVMVVMVVV